MARTATPFMPFEFNVTTGGQMVESGGVEADPSWRHVDSNGHGHFYQSRKDPFPTLRWVSEPCTMGHGEDCDAEGHYECTLCGEEIRPGERLAQPVWIDGPDTYRLTVVTDDGQRVTYEFGESHWATLCAVWVAAAQETLDGFVVEVSQV
jgi:hypothetical protein